MNTLRINNPAKHQHWFGKRNALKNYGISRKPAWWKKAVAMADSKEGKQPIRLLRRMDQLKARW